ncbi:hypothetical protein BREVUG8_100345 [Brevundimonas sp. G8]|nr:hypothetical protein BREVUG8_100345 [Brevundimonas sp. G8]
MAQPIPEKPLNFFDYHLVNHSTVPQSHLASFHGAKA